MEWRKNVHNKNLKSIYVYTSYVKSPNNNNRPSGHESSHRYGKNKKDVLQITQCPLVLHISGNYRALT